MRSLRPFVRWMGDRGIVWADGIHFRCDSEANLGVFTARDMEEGEPIVRIPKASCLTADNTGAAEEVGSCHDFLVLPGFLLANSASVAERLCWHKAAPGRMGTTMTQHLAAEAIAILLSLCQSCFVVFH